MHHYYRQMSSRRIDDTRASVYERTPVCVGGNQQSQGFRQYKAATKGLFLTGHLQNHRIIRTNWSAILRTYIESNWHSRFPLNQ